MSVYKLANPLRGENRIVIRCGCGNPTHQMDLGYWSNEDDLEFYISFPLSGQGGFFHRLRRGLRHAFEGQDRFGGYDELVLMPGDAREIVAFLKQYMASKEEGSTR